MAKRNRKESRYEEKNPVLSYLFLQKTILDKSPADGIAYSREHYESSLLWQWTLFSSWIENSCFIKPKRPITAKFYIMRTEQKSYPGQIK